MHGSLKRPSSGHSDDDKSKGGNDKSSEEVRVVGGPMNNRQREDAVYLSLLSMRFTFATLIQDSDGSLTPTIWFLLQPTTMKVR